MLLNNLPLTANYNSKHVHDIILTDINMFNWKRSKTTNYKFIRKAFVTNHKK